MSELSVAVITPTIGQKRCLNAIRSVWKQTYPVHHIVVVDGPEFVEDYYQNVELPAQDLFQGQAASDYNRTHLELPWATGKVGLQKFWGHRIFAAMGLLVNEDVILFLDDDNTFTEDHVETQVKNLIDNRLHFSYSLRNICDTEGRFLFKDNCESLGKWPVWNSKTYGFDNPDHYHVDTSAYAFRREFLVGVCNQWHGGYAQDRKFYNSVRTANHDTTGKYTLNYNLGSTTDSASLEFFKKGNEVTLNKWVFVGYPWIKNCL